MAMTAPSSPKHAGQFFMSAPSTPKHLTQFYTDFDKYNNNNRSCRAVSVPSNWDDKQESTDHDFTFETFNKSETSSLYAEELFDGGKIRQLQLRNLQENKTKKSQPPKMPKIIIREAFSPRKKKDTRSVTESSKKIDEEEEKDSEISSGLEPGSVSLVSLKSASLSSSRKWKLKDFLLFRSSSEGRSRFSNLFKHHHEEVKNVSFRSSNSSAVGSRRRVPISAHELHYTKNKAASQDLKKKTFLPYTQGLFGRFAFNPALHALDNRFGSR